MNKVFENVNVTALCERKANSSPQFTTNLSLNWLNSPLNFLLLLQSSFHFNGLNLKEKIKKAIAKNSEPKN